MLAFVKVWPDTDFHSYTQFSCDIIIGAAQEIQI